MKVLRKIAFLVLFTVYCLLASQRSGLFTSAAYAADEFETSYQITYTVNSDASVSVQQNMSLINKLANVYATEYQINIGATQISNVQAWDGQGAITPQIETKENSSLIKIKFNQQVVGKDEKLNFGISYLSQDYADLKGQVLEIGIPKIIDIQELKSYQLILKVPLSFDQPIFITPQANRTSQEGNFNVFYFDQSKLAEQSVVAFFGESQIFDFNLTYYLENDEDEPFYFEVAFPPDTPFQKVYYDQIDPLPENISVDPDGNWLGKYLVKTGEIITVETQGSAEIFLKPKTEIKNQPIEDFEIYLQEQEFWEVENEQIKILAQNLKSPQAIYDFVVSELEYSYEKVNQEITRLGALEALNNKNRAVCMEFTDLFIALSRAAGIPAREVNGYAYTNNPHLRPLSLSQDILHAWPEYYDQEQKLWLAVDPTWENTSGLDFFTKPSLNHFSFVFHGLESTYPYAPGAYKVGAQATKDVKVSFGSQLPAVNQEFDLNLEFPEKVLAGLEIKGLIKIKNLGNTALYEEGFDPLPPFASSVEEVSLGRTNIFTQKKIKLDYQFKDKKELVEIMVISPFRAYLIPYGGGLVLILVVFILLFKIIKLSKMKSWKNS